MVKFSLPKGDSSIIKVLGVGGGGNNAVSYMYEQGIEGVDFVICNTDMQHLEQSPVPNKIPLGPDLTEGRGSGANPDVGRQAAEESVDAIKEALGTHTKMVFITAGMGKGTGTGGAPVIARLARELGILTVAIVTSPFAHEGPKRMKKAQRGIEELKAHVDTLIIIDNNKVLEIYANLSYSDAFAQADNVLAKAARGIAEIITVPGHVNVDFEDVHTVMKDSGVAIMGSGEADGESRAMEAVEQALSSPLLNENNIEGAQYILLNISYDEQEVLMDEIDEISTYIRQEAGPETELIMGICRNKRLEDKLSVTVIATGFQHQQGRITKAEKDDRVVIPLNDKKESAPGPDQEREQEKPFKDKRQITFEFDIGKEQEKRKKELRARREQEEPSKEDQKPETPRFKKSDEESDDHRSDATPPSPSGKSERDLAGDPEQRERVSQLKNLSIKLRNPNYLSEIEKEPAYKRRKVKLKDAPDDSKTEEYSRFTVSERKDDTPHAAEPDKNKPEEKDEEQREKRPEIRAKNTYLHDNVD